MNKDEQKRVLEALTKANKGVKFTLRYEVNYFKIRWTLKLWEVYKCTVEINLWTVPFSLESRKLKENYKEPMSDYKYK